jgi:hypothetical protein
MARVLVGTTYALAAFMIGRGLTEETWCWFIAGASLSATMSL